MASERIYVPVVEHKLRAINTLRALQFEQHRADGCTQTRLFETSNSNSARLVKRTRLLKPRNDMVGKPAKVALELGQVKLPCSAQQVSKTRRVHTSPPVDMKPKSNVA